MGAFVTAEHQPTRTNQGGENAKWRSIMQADKACWRQAEKQGCAALRWLPGSVSQYCFSTLDGGQTTKVQMAREGVPGASWRRHQVEPDLVLQNDAPV